MIVDALIFFLLHGDDNRKHLSPTLCNHYSVTYIVLGSRVAFHFSVALSYKSPTDTVTMMRWRSFPIGLFIEHRELIAVEAHRLCLRHRCHDRANRHYRRFFPGIHDDHHKKIAQILKYRDKDSHSCRRSGLLPPRQFHESPLDGISISTDEISSIAPLLSAMRRGRRAPRKQPQSNEPHEYFDAISKSRSLLRRT